MPGTECSNGGMTVTTQDISLSKNSRLSRDNVNNVMLFARHEWSHDNIYDFMIMTRLK